MYHFLASSLRTIAAILVPCGILATLILPRSYGVAGCGTQHRAREYSAVLVGEGLPFIIIRPSGRIAMASRSARRLFGLSLRGSGNLLSLTAGTDAQDALRRAVCYPFERTEHFWAAFPGSGGEKRLYRMETSPMAEGDATGIVLRDITHAAPELTPASDSRMVDVASSMAGPLSVLSGWLETAHEPGSTLSPAAIRAMERQVSLLKEVSAGMGVEQGGSSLIMDEFDLAPVVQDAADQLALRMVETGSMLEFNYSETPFMLRGDAALWQQLAGELLMSTLHEPEARQLRLTAERRGHEAVIELLSDGPAFWKAQPDGRSPLETVRAAVRAQHGEFAYEQTANQGTRYRLSFPV